MVVKRPTGHKIIDQAITAEIIEDYSGDAWVLLASHGLSTGDTVYIVSDIDEYNGFWYVTVTNGSAFKISEGPGTDFVLFYQQIFIEYYRTQSHDWSSIFLPIVYKISNDLWPANSVDTARTISSFSDDNGFTQVTLSGDIKITTVHALEFVYINHPTNTSLNGVWQIVEVTSSSNLTLNLPYDSTNSFSGATVQYYYNNYQVKVKIFAGLNALHPWQSKKPYEEVAELSLTPDENNQVMFSISDYIKMKVAIKNNLTLFSLPLNLDAFTGFYISTAESYDQSDSYSLLTFESAFVDDTFEGYAIAGKLPFKNIYSGDYADYVYTSGSPALWLTNRERLLAVEGYYFDISFIKNTPGALVVMMTKYISDYGFLEEVQYEDQGIGVYRIPITPDANYDSFCVQVRTLDTPGTPESETPVTDFPDDMSTFIGVGTGEDWNVSATPDVTVTIGHSKRLRSLSYAFQLGSTYRVTITYTKVHNSGSGSTHTLALRATDTPNAVYFETIHDTTTGSSSGSVELEFTAANSLMDRIHIQIEDSSNVTVTIDTFEIVIIIPAIPGTTGATVTEEICIDILETCESIDQFTQEARRLLEDGGYRLLE